MFIVGSRVATGMNFSLATGLRCIFGVGEINIEEIGNQSDGGGSSPLCGPIVIYRKIIQSYNSEINLSSRLKATETDIPDK